MTWYSNGTVSVTANSAVVTGAGTAFVANVSAGDALIVVGASVPPVEILAINGDGQLTLARAWPGASVANATYTVMPTVGLMNDLAKGAASLLNTFGGVRDTVGQGMFPDGNVAAPGLRFTADQDTGIYRIGTNTLGVSAGGTRKFEVGTLTVTFADETSQSGLDIVGRSDGASRIRLVNTARSAVNAYLGFDTTAGLVLAGYLGGILFTAPASGQHRWQIGTSLQLALDVGSLRPGADNAMGLGSAGARWAQVFAATGAINTSDARDKDWRGGLSAAELAAARTIAGGIGIFRFRDAIASKGDNARLHAGVMAQQVVAALEEQGLDPAAYAFVCHDTWEATPASAGVAATEGQPERRDDQGRLLAPARPGSPAIPPLPAIPAGDRYGIRYEELAMFLAAAQEQRLAALEAAEAAR